MFPFPARNKESTKWWSVWMQSYTTDRRGRKFENSSRKKMANSETQRDVIGVGGGGGTSIDFIGQDLLQNVLARLPALSFASAACVNRSWNLLCDSILSVPKLASALSHNPSLQLAVEEVFNKVLAQPIRPHFAIVSVGPTFSLQEAHQIIMEKLGTSVPVITSAPYGIMGKDAVTDEFREVQWEVTEDEDPGAHFVNHNRAILLTLGYLPGLKVDAIPMLQLDEEPLVPLVDEFVTDIKEYTSSVSGCISPAGIILFADRKTNTNLLLEKMDYAMSPDTVIVGDGSGVFLYRGDFVKNTNSNQVYSTAAVALLFMKDKDKPHGTGEIQFHVAVSAGLSPIGPSYKAVSVRETRDEGSTWLTARREGFQENLDGQTMLNHIYDEIRDRIQYPAFYIGVIKRRKCSIALDKVRWMKFHAFHEVLGGDEEYLFVGGIGIKTGDFFRFFHSDSHVALSSCSRVSDNFRHLKQHRNEKYSHNLTVGSSSSKKKEEVFGGIIFSCCGRGEPFFGQRNVDSSPFLENFPDVTLTGSFCGGEIGRGYSRFLGQKSEEQGSVTGYLHAYSSVYLVMSYIPSMPEL